MIDRSELYVGTDVAPVVWIIPPYNNAGWPEVEVYNELARYARKHPTQVQCFNIPLEQNDKGPRGDYFSPRAQADAVESFTATFMRHALGGWLLPKDVLLFIESWSPLPHIARVLSKQLGLGVGPRMVGVLMGGAALGEVDTLALPSWLEAQIAMCYDKLQAPSNYFADMYRSNNIVDVAAWPLSSELWKAIGEIPHILSVQRTNQIVFPHRQIPEKGIGLWNEVARTLSTARTIMPDANVYRMWKTRTARGLTKKQLYRLFHASRAVFAHSDMETYGVAVEEAVALGCCPVLNRHPVYEELYGEHAHFHNGTLDGVTRALREVENCTTNHAALSYLNKEDSIRRVEVMIHSALVTTPRWE